MGDSQVNLLIREALRYTAMSAFLLFVDIALLWILVQYFWWPYLLAATVSFSASTLVGYILSTTAVFRHRRLKSQPIEFASFVEGYLGEHYLTGKCGAACLTFVCNFAARRQRLFVHSRTAA